MLLPNQGNSLAAGAEADKATASLRLSHPNLVKVEQNKIKLVAIPTITEAAKFVCDQVCLTIVCCLTARGPKQIKQIISKPW